MTFSFGTSGFSGFVGHSGGAPEPFSAVNGARLAGPSGSHPLHGVSIPELVKSSSGHMVGQVELSGPILVGGVIEGHLRVQATEAVHARGAVIRLVGLRLVEQRRSETHRTGSGSTETSHTEDWVEADGTLFETLPFTEPQIPADLAAGEVFETGFRLPAPPLGPPAAHLGEAIVAWALDVRWDIALGDDAFVALALPVEQNPDLIRAGVGKQGGLSMLDIYTAPDKATIAITTPLPAAPGTAIHVRAEWPGAPGGTVRVELHRRTNAPNGQEGVVASMVAADGALRAGPLDAELLIPAGSPPSFDGAGLELAYIVRVLVDRKLRSDAAIERPVAVA